MAGKCLMLTVAPDGFLWFGQAKLQARLVDGGIEFKEKDPRRAEKCGGALIIVPFEAFTRLFESEQTLNDYLSKSIEKARGDGH